MQHREDLLEYIGSVAEQTRAFVAITGAPAGGKSTLTDWLCDQLNRGQDTPLAVIVPMDGYHLDNSILQQHDLLHRKGAPFTFDATALASDLERIVDNERVNVPVFDRELDLSRAFAREVNSDHQVVLVEGNYLCCDQEPWNALAGGFDCHIHVHAEPEILLQRLIQRWLDHGLEPEQAKARAENNDMLNVQWVNEHSNEPDILYCPADT